jgi:raffinose/stachyose/melibiose transport system substrate-binding protein
VGAGRACVAVDGDQAWYVNYWPEYLLNRNGGDQFVADLVADPTGEMWNDPIVKKSLDELADLQAKGYFIKGYDASKFPEQQVAWAKGDAVFCLNGSWMLAEVADYLPAGFELGALAFPTTDEPANSDVTMNTFGFAVLGKGANPEGAGAFLAYAMKKDMQQIYATDSSNLVTRTDVTPPASLAAGAQVLADHASRADWDSPVVPGAYWDEVLNATVTKIALGTMSVDEAIATAADAQKRVYDAEG